MVKKCLENRTGDTCCDDINRALQMTVTHDQGTCALELIAHGADIQHTIDEGKTVLMLAAEKGLVNVVKTCGRKMNLEHINKKRR